MAGEDAQKVLAGEILADARRRSTEILNAAKSQADKIAADAKVAAQAEVERILAEHRSRARKRAELLLRAVDQEVGRQKLHARAEVMQAALDQARTRLMGISGRQYRDAVLHLAVAAIRQMPADDFLVKVGAIPGENMAPDSLAADIAASSAKEGKAVKVRVQAPSGRPRGVVVESADGRLRWDNTFEARLQRLRPSLRRLCTPMLFEEP